MRFIAFKLTKMVMFHYCYFVFFPDNVFTCKDLKEVSIYVY